MHKANRHTRAVPDHRCASCDDVAVGVITFFTDDGPVAFVACHACGTDALIHSRTRVRFRSHATRAEVFRGLPGSAA
ncbi:hypothetical protein [Xylanimonas ulmi]|uniref:Uncharacterized protein n=1 Tax=Xylanimonas ulmi TaxID=228973 RepID=A0A4Q7M2S9_9MICO|nr:hypothetical protein [Xylanibacterium ulmi]RZS62195.1 hypothetical protein EV386_2516 [Xylanibacterium ulmi]